MFKKYFILLLLAHVIGDFYIQNGSMSDRKDYSTKQLSFHYFYYWITIIVVLVPIISIKVVVFGTIQAILHVIIDLIKHYRIYVLKKNKKMMSLKERNIFILDQMFHFICIVIVAYLFVINGGNIRVWSYVSQFLRIISISGMSLAALTTALLIIHKPSNVTISKLLGVYKPGTKEDAVKKDYNAGRFIGTVERVIMLILISIGQYSAVGLVLTAKSIARYDRISKEKDFAEYYLLGTLLSTVIVITVAILLYK